MKTDEQRRKGRLFRQIIYGLSWSPPKVDLQVPPALWARLKDGWHAGPLLSSRLVDDPDQRGVVWRVWWFGAVFGTDCIWIQSNQMPATDFISLRDLAADSLSDAAGDWPTRGV